MSSSAVGTTVSSSKNMALDKIASEDNHAKNVEASETSSANAKEDNEHVGEATRGLHGEMSDGSFTATEEETDDDDEEKKKIDVGPKYTIKEQLEKDKDDESLRRWKEQLLGSVDLQAVGETREPEVKILSLAIVSPGRPDMVLPVPATGNPKGSWFTLKEGSPYSVQVIFQVSNNIVSGLRYTNKVWKTGVKVDSTKEMLGTFSPQPEPYKHVMPEQRTPSGIFARGSYSARTKFVDDDNKCYLEINYTFEIRKDWS